MQTTIIIAAGPFQGAPGLGRLLDVSRGELAVDVNDGAEARDRAHGAEIETVHSPDLMRISAATAFLDNHAELEAAQQIAAHSDSRTTKLYDRRDQRNEQGEIEQIRFDC